jgi:DNA-binding transcriptional ArsR family regulator
MMMAMRLESSDMLRALAVGTRVKIIDLLKTKGPQGAKAIAETLTITPAAASQHLKILRQAGLVRSQRKGYWIPYSINEEALERCRCMLNEICTCGCREIGEPKREELEDMNLEKLKEYESELENELKIVRERIKEMKPQKK